MIVDFSKKAFDILIVAGQSMQKLWLGDADCHGSQMSESGI